MTFPAGAHAEFLAVAIAAAQTLSVAPVGELVAQLVTELDRAGRTAEAVERLRLLQPELFASIAEHGNDAALAGIFRAEVSSLLTRGGPPAESADDTLTSDFAKLEALRREKDPAWESLFDALEERLESLSPKHHALAAQALLRCGLPRPAYRHWARGGKPVDTKLVVALWQQELEKESRTVVDYLRAHWLSALPHDWTSLGIVVALAIAQAQAGDEEGARASASEARRVARGSAAEVLAPDSGMPPEVAIWHLAHLIPLEMCAAHDEAAARAMLARCEELLAMPRPAKTSWEGRNSAKSTRVTTLTSLAEACRLSGWYEQAFDVATMQKSAADQWRGQLAAVRESGSPDLARRLLGELTDPRQRLELAVAVCRECAVDRR